MARRIFDDSSKVPYGDHEIGTFSGSSVPPFGGDAAHSAPLGVGRGEYPAPAEKLLRLVLAGEVSIQKVREAKPQFGA
jgi:hypothetical protein